MTPSELKANVEGPFFDRKTMKFFGDTMRNYGVRRAEVNGVACFELYRKRPVKNGSTGSTYFNAETFIKVHVC